MVITIIPGQSFPDLSGQGHRIFQSIKIYYGKSGSGKMAEVLESATDVQKINISHKAKRGENFYYFAEIVQAEGDKIVSTPIWVRKL